MDEKGSLKKSVHVILQMLLDVSSSQQHEGVEGAGLLHANCPTHNSDTNFY